MLSIMKNNWNRIIEQRAYLITAIFLTVCAVSAAVILTNKIETKGNIAVVNGHLDSSIDESPYFNITYLEEEPPMSNLVQNRYDAVIIVDNDGSYVIKTIKNHEFKDQLERMITNSATPEEFQNGARKIGTNIIGYMMMFLLIQGVLYARLYAEDKEKHLIERVSMSPLCFTKYMAGQGAFMWMLIFLPSCGVVALASLLGVMVGFSLLEYVLLIGLLAFLAVAFALCLNSFFCAADTANMLGSSIVVLTSILAGSFYSLSKKDSLFNRLLHILPQKDFIGFTDALEKGDLTRNSYIGIGYVLLISVVMIAIAVVKTRKDYVYKK